MIRMTHDEEANDLTGRWRFRTDWRGLVILQVEERFSTDTPRGFHRRWRDATLRDIEMGEPND